MSTRIMENPTGHGHSEKLFVICFVKICVIYLTVCIESLNNVTHFRGYAEQMMLRSPEIKMRITDQDGDDIRTAMVSIIIIRSHPSCSH